MAKKPASKKPASKRKTSPSKLASKPRRIRVRFWPALVAGIILLVLGGWLWFQSSQATYSDYLLRKLPKNSSVAGIARLSKFDTGTLSEVSRSVRLDPDRTAALVQTLDAAGLDRSIIKNAVSDQFAFAHTNRGDLAIFTVTQEADFAAAADRLAGQVTDTKTVDRQTNDGLLKVWQGTTNAGRQSVFGYRSGRELYVATNPELIAAASRETDGFTSLEQFPEVSDRLPAGADAYVFLNVSQLPRPPLAFPLAGVAVSNRDDELKLSAQVADPVIVPESLSMTTGTLLPGTDLAAASVGGDDVLAYVRLLEAQRQESDLPRVIALQNGIASVNRKLGIDLERDVLAQADEFVYARYLGPDGKPQWFGAVRFDSPENATAQVGQLTKLLRERITVPTRREILRNLPDGTQSREIVSEGNEALEITDVMVEGKGGNAATFPAMGSVNWVVDGRYLVLGSTPEAVARMVKTIAAPGDGVGERGELTVRAKLSEVPGLLTGSRDGVFNWTLAAQPESGTFTLNKSSGELQGAVRFRQAGR